DPGRPPRPATHAPGATRNAPQRPRSGPGVLPGNVLIADKANNRLLEVDPRGHVVWRFPRPGDLAPRQTFQVPDDAFFGPRGPKVVATQEDNQAISVID